jgi:beta-glucosidase
MNRTNFTVVSALASGVLLIAWGNVIACSSSKSNTGETSGDGGASGGNNGNNGSSGGGNNSSSGGGSSGVATSSGTTSGGSTDGGIPVGEAGPPIPDGGVQWPSAACVTNTTTLLATMTRLQKAQQMVMANNPSNGDVTTYAPGAVFAPGGASPPGGTGIASWAAMTDGYVAAQAQTPLKIPLLYGLDAVHGNNGATGSVIFPHNAGMASSRNANFVYQAAQIEASEVLAGGVNWAFGPFAGTTWDYRWGRVYESFSEDPTWAGEMLTAEIQGFQGAGGLGSATHLMACSKHAAGDGQGGPPSAKGGVVDRGNAIINQATMEQWGLAQYIPAIQAGLGCIMVSDASWNSPAGTDNQSGSSMTWGGTAAVTLLGLLKNNPMYGFKGFVITDWDAANGNEAAAINAGVDMLMAPDDPWQTAITTIANDTNIPDSRINDAVTRILNAKCQAGLFQLPGGPAPYTRDPSLIADVGNAAHRAVGRQAVQQSLVLLQNNNHTLPISKTANVYVGGSGANNLNRQCGGWSISWQGGDSTPNAPDTTPETTGTTIQQAIAKVQAPVATMAAADVVVIVLSERTYAEFEGDSATLDTLWSDTPTAGADFTLLQQARASGKPVVGIILSGRPVLINSPNHANALSDADAWIAAWLPGTEGDGVADVLFGDYAPTGKLSHSWPSSDASANIMCGMQPSGYAGKNCLPGGYVPAFPLGFGLTY